MPAGLNNSECVSFSFLASSVALLSQCMSWSDDRRVLGISGTCMDSMHGGISTETHWRGSKIPKASLHFRRLEILGLCPQTDESNASQAA